MNRFFGAIACAFTLAVVLALHLESRQEAVSVADQVEDMARVMVTREQLAANVRERVIRLPEDGGAWHLSVWYDERSAASASQQLAEILAKTPRLSALAAQTRVHEHHAAKPDWVYRERYAALPQPGVLLQDAAGKHIFQVAGKEIPADGEALADAIADAVNGVNQASISQCGPDGCPAPRPLVQPAPRPDGESSPDGRCLTRPLIQRRQTAEPSDGEKAAMVLAGLALVALLIFAFKKGK